MMRVCVCVCASVIPRTVCALCKEIFHTGAVEPPNYSLSYTDPAGKAQTIHDLIYDHSIYRY